MQPHPPEDELFRRLTRAAQRAESDPFFLAHSLAAYRKQNGLDDSGLAAYLDCSPAELVNLALCRVPDSGSPRFRADIERIAAGTGVEAIRLVALLRAVEGRPARRGVAEEQVGYEVAPRNCDKEEPAPSEGGHA